MWDEICQKWDEICLKWDEICLGRNLPHSKEINTNLAIPAKSDLSLPQPSLLSSAHISIGERKIAAPFFPKFAMFQDYTQTIELPVENSDSCDM